MNFEKRVTVLRALKKVGVCSAKDLTDFASDTGRLLSSGLPIDTMKAVVDLAAVTGKSSSVFDWLMKEDS